MALLKLELVDTEWKRFMDVSVEFSYKPFIGQRIRNGKSRHLGYLGGLGMPVLKIQNLFCLTTGTRKQIGECDKPPSFIRKDF